jgi:hypothetical protein
VHITQGVKLMTDAYVLHKDWDDDPLASTVTARLMPDVEVSDRTMTMYATGAYMLMKQLMSEQWGPGPLTVLDKSAIQEWLRRVVANADRQDVGLPPEQAGAPGVVELPGLAETSA